MSRRTATQPTPISVVQDNDVADEAKMRGVAVVSEVETRGNEFHAMSSFRGDSEAIGGWFSRASAKSMKHEALMKNLNLIDKEIRGLGKDAEKYKPGGSAESPENMTVVAAQLKRWHKRLKAAKSELEGICEYLESNFSHEQLNAMTDA